MKFVFFIISLILMSRNIFGQYQIAVNSFGNGGSTISNASFNISSTVGQTIIGSSVNNSFDMEAGFWDPVFVVTHIVGVKEPINSMPKKYELEQNYPNPFNPTTTINYSVPKSSTVTIKIYDILGKEVETLVNEQKTAGNYKIEFNADKLASGIYFYQMRAGNFISTKKLVLLK